MFRTLEESIKSGHPYKIFIDNPGFVNRGDQLMIQAVLEQVRHYRPDAHIVVRKSAFKQNPTYCIQNGIYPLESSESFIRRSRCYTWLLNTLLRDQWITHPEEIDLILDCSGYHIADWRIKDAEYVHRLSTFYKRFTKKGRRLILLPQAFGPFNNSYSREAAKIVYDNADYIYAREGVSYRYLNDLFPNSVKIAVAPDFTCLTGENNKRTIILPEKSYVLLIPNNKMIAQTPNEVANSYVNFLVTITRFLVEKGQNVYLLNHEGEKDEVLLHSINEQIASPLPILTKLTGLDIKSLIKDARLVISGRYHGVVSGLTQGVPTLCTGWSHKYAELLKEHGCDGNILTVGNVRAATTIIEDTLTNPLKYVSKSGCEEQIERKVRNMWNSIFE